MSVTFASGETIKPKIPAEKPKSTVSASSVKPSDSESLSTPQSDIPVSVIPENTKKSSISVTFASGETITKRTQPTTIDDSSDSSISPDIDKKDNPEITGENPENTAPTSSEKSPVFDGLSTPQSNVSANSAPETKKQESIIVTSISEETIINQTQPTTTKDHLDQNDNTQQLVNTVHSPIPPESEKPDNSQEKNIVNNQAIANGSSRPRERVKSSAEGHVISEPVSDSSDDPDAHPSHLSEIGAGVALLGGAVAVGGVIAGSTAVTAIGVTAVVVGGTCCLLEGK